MTGWNPGVLSDAELDAAIANGDLVLIPAVDPEQIQPCSIDLRVGREFIFEREGFHTGLKDETLWGVYTEKLAFPEGELITIPANDFVLATTVERVELSNRLAGFVTGRSSVGRTGLFVENAGLIDPGFSGQITLELYNASKFPRQVRVGSLICQLVVERLATRSVRPYGHVSRRSKYQDQRGVTVSKWEEELDNSQPIR